MIDAEKLAKDCIAWIKEWFKDNGGDSTTAVLGMSGGKDSTVAAALLAKALGTDRVIGVAMPAKGQSLNDADKICAHIGIRYICIPIDEAVDAFAKMPERVDGESVTWSKQAEQNIPPKIRMTVLYAVSQSNNGRVVNTCNLSENWLGYATKFGDAAGDFSPLGKLTVTEIRAIGDYLGLPAEWVHKIPDDGLPHSMSDEEKLGFAYETVDLYIRNGVKPDEETFAKMMKWHNSSLHKVRPMPEFEPEL